MKKTPHIININDWYRMVSMEKSCYFGYLLGLNISASGVSQSLETANFEGLPAAGATLPKDFRLQGMHAPSSIQDHGTIQTPSSNVYIK